MISLKGLEAAIGLYLSDVADIPHENLFGDSMVRSKFTALANLGLTVESGDLIHRDRFLLISVRPLEAEPLTNALGRHLYNIELRLSKMFVDYGAWKSRGGLTRYNLTFPRSEHQIRSTNGSRELVLDMTEKRILAV